MTGIYYPQAADWLRAIGITVVETDDWETRARSSGGFPSAPLGVQWHHTAGNMNLQSNIAWMTENSDDAPIGNILLWPDGVAYMIAAGAANTAGKGGPYAMSRGTVPLDQGNTRTWAIEAANNGVGQAWPKIQIDAYHAISNELNRRWGNKPTDLFSHQAWAPTRKIDPATAAAVQGSWRPRSINSSGTWSVDDIKAEANRRASAVPTPPDPDPAPPFTPGPPAPKPTKDDISMVVALDSNGTAWIGDGIKRFPVPSEAIFNNYVVLGKAGAFRFVNTSGQVVSGWSNVATVGGDTIEALGRP